MTAESTLFAVLVPVSVKLSVVFWEMTTEPGFVNWIAPLPDASRDAPLGPMGKRRSVLPPAPAYCSVAPSMTKLLEALEEVPMPLGKPPLARLITLSVLAVVCGPIVLCEGLVPVTWYSLQPPLMVVMPV